jgi:undecaprenyl-diphosphatase
MFRLDAQIFRDLNGFAGQSAWIDGLIVFCATYLIFIMGAAIAVAVAVVIWQERHPGWQRRLHLFLRHQHSYRAEAAVVLGLRAVVAASFAYLFNFIISLIWFRPRPFLTLYHVQQLAFPSSSTKSFPSDHATIAFAMAWAIFLSRRRLGALLLVAATLIALGRVFAGVHYPSDVIAGAAVGFVWAWVARLWERRLLLGRHK